MVEPGIDLMSVMSDRMPMMVEDIKIELFKAADEFEVASLIKHNMERFDDSEAVLAATFRRLNNLFQIYRKEGCSLFVAKSVGDGDKSKSVACAGLGPLHGLPPSEGVGEIRDLVVNENFRGQGIGSRLLHRCIDEARNLGYQRLYLETSQNMVNARKLFLRSGFRPVTESTATESMSQDLPCYFLLENLQEN